MLEGVTFPISLNLQILCQNILFSSLVVVCIPIYKNEKKKGYIEAFMACNSDSLKDRRTEW